MSISYTPLHNPDTNPPFAASVETELRLARDYLDKAAETNIHDHTEMVKAASGLNYRLRALVAALDAERGTEADDDGTCPACDTTVIERCAACGSCRCDRHDNCARPAPRCPAAHPQDPTPCGGPVVVTVLDTANAGADGCEHHGARLLASLDGARVYALPDAPEGAAIRVHKAADTTRPFPWLTDVPRTRDAQLSRAEVRAKGERQ
jgi:hypothetical protein